MELASQRNKAAARRSDPLWYRDEDVLPSTAEETPMAEHAKILPEQVQIVENGEFVIRNKLLLNYQKEGDSLILKHNFLHNQVTVIHNESIKENI